ncbi:MAG: DUF86 domain-containing protein [Chloroflexi bacterium]|nr:DUF86 domain-containing protein [Chloroflexota bacterium]
MDRDLGTILDIVLACQDVETFIRNLDEWQFKADRLVRSATIHQIMIIGEATKRLSPEFRKKHQSIPWKTMAGMRDNLIHGYNKVDLDLVWSVATTEVPALRAQLEPLVPDEKAS